MTAFIFAVVVLGFFSFFRVRRRVREARESAASGGRGGGRGAAALRVAQTAPGADTMIARLQQFPGFRYEPMINSMITTEATRFLVWEQADD